VERTGQTSRRICGEIAKLCFVVVIACDKREPFAQGSEATKLHSFFYAAKWIASLRSQ
jgi:hypothetical protein